MFGNEENRLACRVLKGHLVLPKRDPHVYVVTLFIGLGLVNAFDLLALDQDWVADYGLAFIVRAMSGNGARLREDRSRCQKP